MADNQYTCRYSKLTKWVLAVTLLYSFFTFSGCTSYVQPQQIYATQTEWLFLQNASSQQSISYKRAIAQTAVKISGAVYGNQFSISRYHSLLTLIKLKYTASLLFFKIGQRSMLGVKVIPAQADEPFIIS